MTREELSQIYWLNKEIDKDRRRLKQLEDLATRTVSKIDGLPHLSEITDRTGIAAQIADLRNELDKKILRTIKEYQTLGEYISNIPDSYIRQIMTLRHIHCYSWVKVAMEIGGNNTPDGVRKAHDRYLNKDKG